MTDIDTERLILRAWRLSDAEDLFEFGGLKAVKGLLRYAFETLDVLVVAVCHYPDNVPSKRVIEKCGFTYEGTLRKYSRNLFDSVRYSKKSGKTKNDTLIFKVMGADAVRYSWIDYTDRYSRVVEPWLDRTAKKFTGCAEGWDSYFTYWKNYDDTKIGENFWGKVISDGGVPFAVMTVGFHDGIFTVSEFIVAPKKRKKGYGSSALRELLACGEKIVGQEIQSCEAVIFQSNVASQRAFEKAGFVFERAHPDGDAWYYTYRKAEMPCFCGHDCARCVTRLATVNNDNKLREQSRRFYKETFGYDIPLSEIRCMGGRTDDIFKLCHGCPFGECCRGKGFGSCSECGDYPCKLLAGYIEKYVNKCNQV